MATPFMQALDLTNRWQLDKAEINRINQNIQYQQWLETQTKLAEENDKRRTMQAWQLEQQKYALPTPPQDQGPQSPPPGQPSSPMAPSPPGGGGLPPPVGQPTPTPMASAVTQMPQPSGWRPSPVAPMSLGGKPPVPSGAPSNIPSPPPGILDSGIMPPKTMGTKEVVELINKQNIPLEDQPYVFDKLMKRVDDDNKRLAEDFKRELEIKTAQVNLAKEMRLQWEAQRGKPIAESSDIKQDIFAAGGDPTKPIEQQSPQVIAKAQQLALAKQTKAGTTVRVSLGGEGKAPSGYRWSKTEPGQLEAIPGGPADPQVVASKKNAIQLTGGRESVYTTRVMQAANQASKDLANIVKVPVMTTGIFGGRHQGPSLIDATKEVLAQKMTSQEAQTYNVMATGLQRTLASVETSGLAQGIQEFSKQIDVVAKEGDTELTKLHKLAQVRQIIEAGLEPVLANPRVAESEKDLVRKAIENVHSAVPFTHSDLIELTARQEANSNTTLRDVLPKFKGGKPGTSKYVETRTTADGRTLGKKADGTIEEVK